MMRFFAACFCLVFMQPAQAEAPSVATDIAPVHALVARVMQGVGEPELILPQDASPHSYALRPSQASALQSADLVIWVGPALTPWLGEAMDTLATSADQLVLLDIPGTVLLPWREQEEFAGGEEAHDHDHDDHDHGEEGVDPHVWLDPQNASFWLVAIAEMLSVHDAEHASQYRANAHAGQAELAALITGIETKLAPVRGLSFVVSHDALHYFETRFDVHASGAVADGDAAAPGAARLAYLREMMEKNATTCVLVEPGIDTSRLASVFGDDLTFAEADLLGRNHTPGAGLYPALIADIADNLASCASR